MKFITIIAALAVSMGMVSAAPLQGQQIGAPIPNRYIVVYKNTVEPSTLASHESWLETTARLGSDAAPTFRRKDNIVFPDIPKFDKFNMVRKYQAGTSFRGYTAEITPEIAESLKNLPEVAYVEQDRVVGIYQTPTPAADNSPWGLRRLTKDSLPLPQAYTFDANGGAGVDAYIIDTGVLVSHPDFEGRARVGASFSTDNNDVDGNGHGTHVAGTVGSKTYGVAKKVNLIAVKVLASNGTGSDSDVIAGVEWVAREARRTGRKSVANMSLGGEKSEVLDLAIKAAIESGVTFVVAAGNSAKDACLLSPSNVKEAITVAASDINDRLASFSERGPCVDIIAPGVNVLSTWNNGRTRSISGTSMASPHVAGVVAVALSKGVSSNPAEVTRYVLGLGVSDKIRGVNAQTVNLLAQLPK
ncbi:serine protease [Chytridiales sp. JEL 0842]|nr:serine protease [Chytridiales sp. JEL 0842]